MDIGARIKHFRNKMSLTLEELASRTELTKGFLSQLENNLTQPSITTLEDITEALGVNLEKFFKEENHEKIIFKDNDYFIDKQDEYTISYIVPNAQKNEMEPILLELNSNGKSKIIEAHEGEEFGYVISGRINILNMETNQKQLLTKGETFYLKGGFTHCLTNESQYKAVILWVCTPPLF